MSSDAYGPTAGPTGRYTARNWVRTSAAFGQSTMSLTTQIMGLAMIPMSLFALYLIFVAKTVPAWLTRRANGTATAPTAHAPKVVGLALLSCSASVWAVLAAENSLAGRYTWFAAALPVLWFL